MTRTSRTPAARVVAFAITLAVTLAATLACVACTRAASPTPEAARPPIFRYVTVNAGRIVLGAPLPAAVARSGEETSLDGGKRVVALAPGSFAGASGMSVHLAPDRTVAAVTFVYGPDASFPAMVADYTSSLGPPARSRLVRPGEEPADVALWEDARTTLRLVRDPNRSAWTIRAELRDRR